MSAREIGLGNLWRLKEFCQSRWISELSIYQPRASGNAFYLAAEFAPRAQQTLLDLLSIQRDLAVLLGIRIYLFSEAEVMKNIPDIYEQTAIMIHPLYGD
jgi:hypothetical protein